MADDRCRLRTPFDADDLVVPMIEGVGEEGVDQGALSCTWLTLLLDVVQVIWMASDARERWRLGRWRLGEVGLQVRRSRLWAGDEAAIGVGLEPTAVGRMKLVSGSGRGMARGSEESGAGWRAVRASAEAGEGRATPDEVRIFKAAPSCPSDTFRVLARTREAGEGGGREAEPERASRSSRTTAT